MKEASDGTERRAGNERGERNGENGRNGLAEWGVPHGRNGNAERGAISESRENNENDDRGERAREGGM